MLNFLQFQFKKMKLKALIMFLICSPIAYAEIDQLNEIPPDEDINSNPLKSQTTLSSLKNLKPLQLSPAPFVQELHNRSEVRTLFVGSHDLPIVDLQITFHAGSAYDNLVNPGLSGTANMAAKLMSEGTDLYSAKQISDRFNSLGTQYSINSYRDMFIIRLRVLSDPDKFQPALELLLHLIKHANFNASGLNLVLNNTKIGQKQVQENPSRLMNIKLYRTIYGTHPYAEPTVGTQGSIRKINAEILKRFRDQLLVAQNSNIAITGDLTAQRATEISEKITQALPQGERALEIPDIDDGSDFNIQFIPHNSDQAYISMGHLGIRHSDPDRIALEVANRIFGGGSFHSLLSKELRIKRGYTYSASSSLSSTAAPGVFSFSYSTQQNQLMDSIQVAHQTFVEFIKQPISKSQLTETKEGMLRAYPMNFASNAAINAQIASIGFYGLDTDYLNQYQEKLASLTTKDIQYAIKKHLHADKMTVIVVAQSLDQQNLKSMLENNIHADNADN